MFGNKIIKKQTKQITPVYMFNVYKNQQSRQTGSRNLTSPKTLPKLWHTYMKLVTKYQISAINSCRAKYLGRTELKQYIPSVTVNRHLLFLALKALI
jgi:hypothetical protein